MISSLFGPLCLGCEFCEFLYTILMCNVKYSTVPLQTPIQHEMIMDDSCGIASSFHRNF